ncbi:cobalamin-binding protein [Candidatus Sororendozoicomonas aggregata]|uniref:cobalamin-binding protein n=1 Tax=Candidatus Sororendozoicomonas aggregata TaxID=3073239 RepID=UPI002ED342E4
MGQTTWVWLLTLLAGVASFSAAESNRICSVDGNDRHVCLSSPPARIISLSPGTTELLFEAGAGPQVIAVDKHSDYPPRVKQLPDVGGFPQVSEEAIVKQRPDLVVIWSNGNSPTVAKQLEKLGLKTFYINVRTLDDIPQALHQLGEITNNTTTATTAAQSFNHTLTLLEQTFASRTPLSVFFEIWKDPLMTVGSSQVIHEAITVCGGHNVFGNMPQSIPTVSIEALLTSNPQVIIDASPTGQTPAHFQKQLTFWQQWPSLAAVEKQHFITLQSDLITRPTSRMLQGVKQLCQQLDVLRQLSSTTQKRTEHTNAK